MFLADDYNFSSTEKLNTALSGEIADVLASAISKKGAAVLVVSGGNTHAGMLSKLSEQVISWSNVTVLLTNDRWIATTHNRSHEGMVRRYLLQNEAAKASFVGFYASDIEIDQAPTILEDKLDVLNRPVDALILGMGEDGHTAPLFLKTENMEDFLNVKEGPKTTFVKLNSEIEDRITLSFSVLTNAHHIFLHFTGVLKKEVYQKIVSGDLQTSLGRVLDTSTGHIKLFWAA
ncbi:MAG: 6-phosphogluconolactonase [Sneathiella sp.]|nr:6-phosphogluconolactonase [Sneathiella sp.]